MNYCIELYAVVLKTTVTKLLASLARIIVQSVNTTIGY
jgi:hypothetical protein